MHGRVICLCGDIPASNYIGGFKEGVGFSLQNCRRCMATSIDMNSYSHCSETFHVTQRNDNTLQLLDYSLITYVRTGVTIRP